MITFYVLVIAGVRRIRKEHSVAVIILIGYALYTALVLFPVRTESRYLIASYLWLLPLALVGVRTITAYAHRTVGSWRVDGP